MNEIDLEGYAKRRNLYGCFAGRDLRVGYDRLKAIREAVGDQIDIIVEAHALTDTTSAIEFGRMDRGIPDLRLRGTGNEPQPDAAEGSARQREYSYRCG